MIALDASLSIAESDLSLQKLLRTVARIQPVIKKPGQTESEHSENSAEAA